MWAAAAHVGCGGRPFRHLVPGDSFISQLRCYDRLQPDIETRRLGAIGECDARTQRLVRSGATDEAEDNAACLPSAARLDRPGPVQWELANRVRSGRKQR